MAGGVRNQDNPFAVRDLREDRLDMRTADLHFWRGQPFFGEGLCDAVNKVLALRTWGQEKGLGAEVSKSGMTVSAFWAVLGGDQNKRRVKQLVMRHSVQFRIAPVKCDRKVILPIYATHFHLLRAADVQIDLYGGVKAVKTTNGIVDNIPAHIFHQSDGNCVLILAFQCNALLINLLELIIVPLEKFLVHLSGGCQGNAPFVPVEQGHMQISLHLGNLIADGGLGDMVFFAVAVKLSPEAMERK